MVITTCVVAFCFIVRKHYKKAENKLAEADKVFAEHLGDTDLKSYQFLPIENKAAKTAVIFVNTHYGAGLHTLRCIGQLFPNIFQNYVFLTSGEIDSESLANDDIFKKKYRQDLENVIERYRFFCTENKLQSDGIFSYGTNEISQLIKLAGFVVEDYSDCVFFASRLVFIDESWWTRVLHSNTDSILQRELQLQGKQMVILAMKI